MTRSAILTVFTFALSLSVSGQNIEMIKAVDLKRWTENKSDTVFVLNFWATWCAPCVAELPGFERLHRKFAGKKVEVLLISNDFRKNVESKVIPFIRERQLKSRVLYMDESNPNRWIDDVHPDWGGAIPATLIVSRGRKFEFFLEGEMSYRELKKIVVKALKG